MTKDDKHPANTWRGEVALSVAGSGMQKDYVLVPSYRNLAAIEDACGFGLLDLVDRYEQKSLRISELAAVISATSAPAMSVDEAGDLIGEMGLAVAYTHVGRFLAAVLFPGEGDGEATSEADA